MIPQLRVALIAPDVLLDDRAFIRIHNKAAKDALRDVAIDHWKRRIPGHFKATARGKYGYAERKPIYKAIKLRRYKSRTDLVRTGDTRDSIIGNQPEIRLGGRAANADGTTGQLRLTMKMALPFGQKAQDAVAHAIRTGKMSRGHASGQDRFGGKRPGVTIDEIKREIAAITVDEAKEIAASFGEGYTAKLKEALKSRPRIRKRIEELAHRS